MDNFELGVGPIPESNPGGGLISLPLISYQTPLLDLTKVTLGIELIPAKPGFVPFVASSFWSIEKASGTQTASPTTQLGSDVAHTNVYGPLAAQPSNADVNGANVPSIAQGNISSFNLQLFPNAPCMFDVTAGAQGTGAFSLMGRFNVDVFWIQVRQ
jgi:hypothetical protein